MVHYNGTIILYGGMSDLGLDDDKFYQYIISKKIYNKNKIIGKQ